MRINLLADPLMIAHVPGFKLHPEHPPKERRRIPEHVLRARRVMRTFGTMRGSQIFALPYHARKEVIRQLTDAAQTLKFRR